MSRCDSILFMVIVMDAKTEEFLYLLSWTAEMITCPTFRNLTESFEGWAYRRGFLRQLQRLEQQKLLERQAREPGERLLRLTDNGRLIALGGRDPSKQWSRRWDGKWRMVLFDVPQARSKVRNKLRRYLKNRGFGCLQLSAWISPDPVEEERLLLAREDIDAGSLIFLEARPCGGENDSDIVASAWDFEEVNRRYNVHLELLAKRPKGELRTKSAAAIFHRWLREEHQAWLDAVQFDPLLPECLLPSEYLGRKVWRDRIQVMSEAGNQMRSFQVR
jgi:phenylacetic acid degradation operon negative regulatory protein